MASSIDFDLSSKRAYFDINAVAAASTATATHDNDSFQDSIKSFFSRTKRQLIDLTHSIRTHAQFTNAMHATLILGTVLAAATAVLAYPRASQRPLAATDNPRDTWDSSFTDTCSKEGEELIRYQFECPADQIYCPSQIACVHPWACSEPCRDSDLQTRGGGRPGTNVSKKSGKACRPFVCERPGTFVDPLNCGRYVFPSFSHDLTFGISLLIDEQTDSKSARASSSTVISSSCKHTATAPRVKSFARLLALAEKKRRARRSAIGLALSSERTTLHNMAATIFGMPLSPLVGKPFKIRNFRRIWGPTNNETAGRSLDFDDSVSWMAWDGGGITDTSTPGQRVLERVIIYD
jgi:hypothetical protein